MSIDKDIILKFKEGDTEAFDTIYRKFSNKIYFFVLGITKEEPVSKDIVQEVFINLWEKSVYVNQELNFENYIFTITYNAIRKYFRKKSIETKAYNYLLKNSPEGIDDSDKNLIFQELIEIANKTIDNLPPQRKKVYTMSKQEGMKIKEIAGKLNISPRTAENHLAKALKYLREELSDISLLTYLFFYMFLK
jgi:RNA polymerase sigma-70 factor (ECF subfamily)